MTRFLSFSILVIVSSSCASSYKAIKPANFNYQISTTHESVDFLYKYNVLSERGNRKYSKKESRKNIIVVAVKIVNNADKSFVFGDDMKVYSNGNAIPILK